MEKIKSFFKYLFSINPGKEFEYYIPMIVLIAILIAGSIVFSYIYTNRKNHDFAFKRLFKKTSTRMTLLGLLFAALTVFRYEKIPYFSMRIWLFLSFALLAYFVYANIKKFKIDYKREKENAKSILKKHASKDEMKYLPNKKKHS